MRPSIDLAKLIDVHFIKTGPVVFTVNDNNEQRKSIQYFLFYGVSTHIFLTDLIYYIYIE